MTILSILHIPDKRLRQATLPVDKINKETLMIIEDMRDTMYHNNGIGLAANQVNIYKSIIVIDISEKHKECLVLINPKIIKKSGSIEIEEGCLSIPGQKAFIPRAEKIKITALNINGITFELEACGLLAICIQHEMDHLIGKLFIDYLSPLKQQRIKKKVEKINRLYC